MTYEGHTDAAAAFQAGAGETCEVCGEALAGELGEFTLPDSDDSFIAHADCGLQVGGEVA
jgi:hypothetical protein